MTQVFDPLRALKGLEGFIWYLKDYTTYKKLPQAESINLIDLYPTVHERNKSHEIDSHYYYVNSWAMRLIISSKPKYHVDVASQVIFSALLSAVIPVTYIDYRPIDTELNGLKCISGSATDLPFKDELIESISCLHVAEHIGLGRYGDPLDPLGTLKAACELQRVLSPGGNLFFAVPVGRQRLCFNAHRIHSAKTICEYFSQLELIEFSGVYDNGTFVSNVKLSEFDNNEYACGMFWFRKRPNG